VQKRSVQTMIDVNTKMIDVNAKKGLTAMRKRVDVNAKTD